MLNKKQWIMAFQASAWKVAVILFLIAWWSHSQTSGSTMKALKTLQLTMQPTMNYYDANQDATAIVEVSYDALNAACETGWSKDDQLFNWPGTKKSSSHSRTDAKSLYSWRGATFCYRRAATTDHAQLTSGTTCPAGMTQCDSCNCYTECPVTGFTVGVTEPSDDTFEACSEADAVEWPADSETEYTAYCQHSEWTSTTNHSPMVDISADVYGTSCVSPAAHASGTSYRYLNQVSKGCTSFGTDSFARLADTMTQSDFLVADTQNNAAMTTTRLFSDYTSSLTGQMVLQGRYRVATSCTSDCRNFRFGDSGKRLLHGFKQNFEYLVWLMKVAFWSSVVTLVFGLYVQFGVKKEFRTQNHYFYLACWCIFVTFVTFFLLCKLWISLDPWGSHGYVDRQHVYSKWVKMKCVSDSNWSKVMSSFYHTTSLANFTWWVKFWTVITCLLFVWLVFAVYWVTQKLNKRRQYNEIDHNDVELGY